MRIVSMEFIKKDLKLEKEANRKFVPIETGPYNVT